jgi:soluble lytic murein transglycosylase
MEKKLLTLAISSLLFISVSIFSQASNRDITLQTSSDLSDLDMASSEQISTGKINAPLMLANISMESDASLSNIFERDTSQPNASSNTKNQAPETAPETIFNTVKTEYFTEKELIKLREVFKQAEKAVKRNDKARYLKLVKQLNDYPLVPYLKYQWLKKHLDEEAEVKLFITLYESSRYANKLKHRKLFRLAKQRKWSQFEEYYTASSNVSLQCYHLRAQYKSGEKDSAIAAAKDLWNVGYSQPKACNPIFKQLKKSSLYTNDLVWQRFEKTLRNNKVSLAVYLKSQLPKSQQATAQLWINLHRRPERHIQALLKKKQKKQTPAMFTHTISRLANKDITSAIRIWDANKQNYDIGEQHLNKLEKKLAFKLVFKRESGAYDRFSQLSFPDSSSREWRVRVALSEQNWPNVLTAIEALSAEEKKTEKWQYWQARAFIETGEAEKAEKILSELSTRRDFYGYLAADKMNTMYQLSNNPSQVTEPEITALSERQPYRVAYELKKLGRKSEAKFQWWHALRTLNKQEITVAAKLAQQWKWDEIAIFTIAKVKHWDDIEMRFPLSYSDKIHKNSAKNDLNPAIVFGLVRRESAFNEKARSPTGARGLMQIMPQTGKQIAKHLNERWRGSSSLDNPETNIKYGVYYYQRLLKKFDGNYALALAAYNAGPERVKKWLPKADSMPADIWIETIPYHETRDYVSTVITYALIYQQRTQTNELSMNDFTPDVVPLSSLSSRI